MFFGKTTAMPGCKKGVTTRKMISNISMISNRLPWSKVVPAGIEVIADVEAEKTPALAWELWLRKKVIKRIPGG